MSGFVVDFSRDVAGKFNPYAGFSTVKFGTDGLILEDTLNEMQWILYQNFSSFLRNVTGSGMLIKNYDNYSGYETIDYSVGTGTAPIFTLANSVYNMYGYISYLCETNFTSEQQILGLNRIQLPSAPTDIERYDLVYLECWFEELDRNSTIYKFGVDGGLEITNNMYDSRYPNEETDRRIQFRSRLMVKENVAFDDVTNPYGLLDPSITARGGNSTMTGTIPFFHINPEMDNIFVAGDGSSSAKSLLKSVTGYVFAMALFKIRRLPNSDITMNDITDLRRHLTTFSGVTDMLNSHIGSGGSSHAVATTSEAGFMSASDKQKLDGIEPGATGDMTRSEIIALINAGGPDELKADYLYNAAKDQTFTADDFEPKFTKNTAFNKNFGTTAGTVCEGNDPRLLTTSQKNELTGGGNSTLHYHDADRDWNNITNKPSRFRSDAISTATGDYATLDISKGLLPSGSGAGYTLGNNSNRWYEVHAVTFVENGMSLVDKYLGKTAQAADSAKLGGQLPSYYATSADITDLWNALSNHENDGNAHKDTWRPVSDSVTTTDSVTCASLTAVKTAYDKAVVALNTANSKWTWDSTQIAAVKVDNATNSDKLGGVLAANYARSDVDDTINGTYTFAQGALIKKIAVDGQTYTILDDNAILWNAGYNDIAEWFEREDLNEEILPGHIVEQSGNGVTKSKGYARRSVVGVYSDTFGSCLGGMPLPNPMDNAAYYVPVGLAGRVDVFIKGTAEIGDFVVSSDIPGVGVAIKEKKDGCVLGIVLENKFDEDIRRIKMLITRM